MSARDRIDAATRAIDTAFVRWSGRDAAHQAAVELESRGLLATDRAVLLGRVRNEFAAVVQMAIDAHEAEHPFTETAFRLGMREALLIVLNVGAVTDGSPGDLFDATDPSAFGSEGGGRS